MRDDIPLTGIAGLDAPAVESPSFAQKMVAIRKMGYQVIEDAEFMARGEFDIDERTFTYNATTMTRLDLIHEWRHYKQLVRLEKQGLSFRSRGSEAAEVGAYRFEQRLWQRIGQAPVSDYLRFHSQNVSRYLEIMNSRRVQNSLRYHPVHAEVFR